MNTAEVRQKYLNFMKARGHAVVPSAGLVPENDPTTLFTGSGMQPMLPYLLGKKHPNGVRVTNSQRSFRAQDIEEVGDNRHTTYFEMLGNWSFGDYFKKEQLAWFYEFLTKKVSISSDRISVTCFAGDEQFGLPKDLESYEIWRNLGIPEERILFYPSKNNWWSRGGPPETTPVGDPCGPDSEVFYDFGLELGLHEQSTWKNEKCHPNCDCGRFMEIGNSVFMKYKKVSDTKFELLPRKNFDFGGGLERITAASNNDRDVFKLDIFATFRAHLEQVSGKQYGSLASAETKLPLIRSFRIVMDHVRAAHALIEDGVRPSNTEQGYILRRLLRRAIVHADKLGVAPGTLLEAPKSNPSGTEGLLFGVMRDEESKFRRALDRGMQEIKKGERDVFKLVTSYGLPVEVLKEFIEVDEEKLKKQVEGHQELSRAGSEQKFKGGLADTSDMSVKYHTATHLLQQALRTVLGTHVYQKGSNITPERLRFDFSHPDKMTNEQKSRVEEIVNKQIALALPVTYQDLPLGEAQELGAIGLFEEKYGDPASVSGAGKARVYKIGDFSLEFCGGPHVMNTKELGEISLGDRVTKLRFVIRKEEAVSSGVRRIKAVLES